MLLETTTHFAVSVFRFGLTISQPSEAFRSCVHCDRSIYTPPNTAHSLQNKMEGVTSVTPAKGLW